MKRLASLVAAVTALLAFSGVGAASAAPTPDARRATAAAYDDFVGTFYGHTRHLTVRDDHIAREVIYDGCCTHGITVRYRITASVGDKHNGYLRARVLRVRLGDWTGHHPHRGDVKRITVHHGVFVSHHTGTNYCTRRAGMTGVCGA
jgi:hypothetical protein